MRRIILFVSIAGIIGVFSSACSHYKSVAQELPVAQDSTSLLWKITGNGLQQPSFLFGTIHAIDSVSFFWPATFQKAFDATNRLVMEVDISKKSFLKEPGLLQRLMIDSNKTLEDLLSSKQYDSLKIKMQAMDIPLMLMKRIQPLFLQQFVVMKKKTTENVNLVSYEMYLSNMAKDKDYTTAGLETFNEQLAIIDSIPAKKQAKMLYETVMNIKKSRAELQKLINFYTAENLDSLGVMVNGDDEFQEDKQILLKNRNLRWIPKIKEYIKDTASFFAVGAGHLPGKVGLIHLLREQGYTLIPIQSEGSALQEKYMEGIKQGFGM